MTEEKKKETNDEGDDDDDDSESSLKRARKRQRVAADEADVKLMRTDAMVATLIGMPRGIAASIEGRFKAVSQFNKKLDVFSGILDLENAEIVAGETLQPLIVLDSIAKRDNEPIYDEESTRRIYAWARATAHAGRVLAAHGLPLKLRLWFNRQFATGESFPKKVKEALDQMDEREREVHEDMKRWFHEQPDHAFNLGFRDLGVSYFLTAATLKLKGFENKNRIKHFVVRDTIEEAMAAAKRRRSAWPANAPPRTPTTYKTIADTVFKYLASRWSEQRLDSFARSLQLSKKMPLDHNLLKHIAKFTLSGRCVICEAECKGKSDAFCTEMCRRTHAAR